MNGYIAVLGTQSAGLRQAHDQLTTHAKDEDDQASMRMCVKKNSLVVANVTDHRTGFSDNYYGPEDLQYTSPQALLAIAVLPRVPRQLCGHK
jgi:hypothetical protein